MFLFRFYDLIHFPNVLHFHPVNRSPPAGDSAEYFLRYCLELCLYCVCKSELSQVAASFGQVGHLQGKMGQNWQTRTEHGVWVSLGRRKSGLTAPLSPSPDLQQSHLLCKSQHSPMQHPENKLSKCPCVKALSLLGFCFASSSRQ